MSYGNFAPVYTHIKQLLMQERERVQYMVLDCLAQHCDELGLCYPGNSRLAEMCGYAPETIERALDALVARGWIQIYLSPSVLRKTQPNRDIQLSPHVFYVREDIESDAWKIWGSQGVREQIVMEIEINVQEPESLNQNQNPESLTRISEPDSVTTTTNHHQSPRGDKTSATAQARPLTVPSALEKPPAAKNVIPIQRVAQSPNQRVAQQNHATNGSDKTPPPIPGNPPQDFRAFHKPLPDESLESIAQQIRDEFKTRITQARQLVACHDLETVRTAIRYVHQERTKGAVKNPYGLLKWWLKTNAITPDESFSSGNGDEYMPGQYDAYLKS